MYNFETNAYPKVKLRPCCRYILLTNLLFIPFILGCIWMGHHITKLEHWIFYSFAIFGIFMSVLATLKGLVARTTHYIELYRVVDYEQRQNLLQLLVGIKTVIILSRDRTNGCLKLVGIKARKDIVGEIRRRVEFNKRKREFMKLQIKKNLLLTCIFIFSVWIKGYSQGVATSNPLQYAAIQKGEANLSAKIKSQTDNMNDLAGVQGSMVKDAATMKKWEKQYNAYLITAKGYAEKIAAAATLYQDGMQTLTYLWEIDQARKINPEGVFASMSMNNLYMETATEFTKAYRILNKVIKAGGKESMLNGVERTMLLWQLSEELEVLNKKLRSLALSVCIYNFEDVWNRAIAGKIEKTNGMIASDAIRRHGKAMKQVARFYRMRQEHKPWFQ